MPNRNSHAQHTPQRTCVVCKTRKDLSGLLSFVLCPQGLVFDPRRRIAQRRNYVCPERPCLEGLDKWKRSRMKKKFGIAGEPVFTRAGKTLQQREGQ